MSDAALRRAAEALDSRAQLRLGRADADARRFVTARWLIERFTPWLPCCGTISATAVANAAITRAVVPGEGKCRKGR